MNDSAQLTYRLRWLLPAAGIFMSALASAALTGPIRTEGGLVEGTTLEKDPATSVYRGIPYAAAPVGELRFRPPAPVKPWQGVRSAKSFGLVCPHMGDFDYDAEVYAPPPANDPTISEDCLNLDVYTGASSSSERRPVMVWFHGGTRGQGSSQGANYAAGGLVKKGVILVVVNFRNGPLGMLATPELSRESGHHASGNYSLMDDIASLQWVQENIAAFGGDPARVTIFGESYGAGTVNFLALSPMAKGLFQRRITQSHSLYSRDPLMLDHGTRSQSLKEAEISGEKYLKLAGMKTAAELRQAPWQKLYEAFGRSFNKGPYLNEIPWTYVIDGYVVPHTYTETYARGEQVDADALTGENNDENGAAADTAFDLIAAGKGRKPPFIHSLLPRSEYLAFVRERYGAMGDELLKLYPLGTDRETFLNANAAIRDRAQISPWLWAQQVSVKGKKPVYIYVMTHKPSGPERDTRGTYHGADLPFIFNNPQPGWNDEDRRVAEIMSTYWANFAKTGNPNGPGLPQWDVFDGKTQTTMTLGGDFKPIPFPNATRVEFWKRFFANQPAL